MRRTCPTNSSGLERLQERIAESCQLFLQTLRAIMSILYLDQLEVLLPIRPLLKQRCRTEADLNPAGRTVRSKLGVLHVAQIPAAGYRTFAQCSLFNRLEKGPLAAWPETGAHQIPHRISHSMHSRALLDALASAAIAILPVAPD